MDAPSADKQSPASRSFFRTASSDYAVTHYGPGTRSFMTVRQEVFLARLCELPLAPGARVLDAGCGPGPLTEALSAQELEPFAMDASPEMLRLARERVAGRPPYARFAVGNVEALPYATDSFDLVCSAGVLEYLSTDAHLLREFARVLRPGGFLILSTTNRLSHAGWFDALVEAAKRTPAVLGPFNALWTRLGNTPVRPRPFPVRRHRPAEFRASLRAADFSIQTDSFFYFLPWPHPMDRLAPGLTARMEERLAGLDGSRARVLGEGYLAVARNDS